MKRPFPGMRVRLEAGQDDLDYTKPSDPPLGDDAERPA